MSLVIPLTSTQNDYASATTFVDPGNNVKGYLIIANAAVYMRATLGAQGQGTPYPEVPLPPSFVPLRFDPKNPCRGLAFRSFTANTPAIVYGAIFQEQEQQLEPAPFSSSISGTGVVTVAGTGMTTLFDSGPLAAATASIPISGISQAYTHLQLWMICRLTSANVTRSLNIGLINGDAAGNYDQIFMSDTGALTPDGGETLGATGWTVTMPAGSATAAYPGILVWDIPFYTNTTFEKQTTLRTSYRSSTASLAGRVTELGLHWRSTAAINAFSLVAQAGSLLDVGTRAILYGIT